MLKSKHDFNEIIVGKIMAIKIAEGCLIRFDMVYSMNGFTPYTITWGYDTEEEKNEELDRILKQLKEEETQFENNFIPKNAVPVGVGGWMDAN